MISLHISQGTYGLVGLVVSRSPCSFSYKKGKWGSLFTFTKLTLLFNKEY